MGKEWSPPWPGQLTTAHWDIPVPGAGVGTREEIERAYRQAFTVLDRRITLSLSLPLARVDEFPVQKKIDHIGKQ